MGAGEPTPHIPGRELPKSFRRLRKALKDVEQRPGERTKEVLESVIPAGAPDNGGSSRGGEESDTTSGDKCDEGVFAWIGKITEGRCSPKGIREIQTQFGEEMQIKDYECAIHPCT